MGIAINQELAGIRKTGKSSGAQASVEALREEHSQRRYRQDIQKRLEKLTEVHCGGFNF